jgi:hypothetical protein
LDDAKRIRLFLWDSNEVFEIISKIIFESKDPSDGNTEQELASLQKKLISNDYSTMMIQFLSCVKTSTSSKGMIANLSSNAMGPRVLTITDAIIDSSADEDAIRTIKIYFVPRPTCIIRPITVSLCYDWIYLRRFELDEMKKYKYDLNDFEYRSYVTHQLNMFKFMCRNLNEHKTILRPEQHEAGAASLRARARRGADRVGSGGRACPGRSGGLQRASS